MMSFKDEIYNLAKKNTDGKVLLKTVEECRELVDALHRAGKVEKERATVLAFANVEMASWGREDREAVISEMADVAIMLRQLALKLECADELDALMEYKVARTKHEMKQVPSNT